MCWSDLVLAVGRLVPLVLGFLVLGDWCAGVFGCAVGFPVGLDLCCFVIRLLWDGLVIAGLWLMVDLLFVLCVVAFWVELLSGLVRDELGVFCVLCFEYVCFCGFGLFAFVLLLIRMVWWVWVCCYFDLLCWGYCWLRVDVLGLFGYVVLQRRWVLLGFVFGFIDL